MLRISQKQECFGEQMVCSQKFIQILSGGLLFYPIAAVADGPEDFVYVDDAMQD